MRPFWVLCAFLPCAFLSSASAFADVSFEFELGNQAGFSVVGNEFTRTVTDLEANGVIFDATITVVGFDSNNVASDVKATGSGLGVSGTGNDLINDGEYLRAFVSIANVSGGTATFDGFEAISLLNFEGSESAILSLDALTSTTGDNQALSAAAGSSFAITLPNPTTVHLLSTASDFRAGSLTARFSAVPEPNAFVLSALFGSGLVWRRRKRV